MRSQRIDWDMDPQAGAVLLRVNGLIVARFEPKDLLASLHGLSGAFLGIFYPEAFATIAEQRPGLAVVPVDPPAVLTPDTPTDGAATTN